MSKKMKKSFWILYTVSCLFKRQEWKWRKSEKMLTYQKVSGTVFGIEWLFFFWRFNKLVWIDVCIRHCGTAFRVCFPWPYVHVRHFVRKCDEQNIDVNCSLVSADVITMYRQHNYSSVQYWCMCKKSCWKCNSCFKKLKKKDHKFRRRGSGKICFFFKKKGDNTNVYFGRDSLHVFCFDRLGSLNNFGNDWNVLGTT